MRHPFRLFLQFDIHARQSIFHQDAQGSSGRRRNSQSDLFGPCRAYQKTCCRCVHIHADGHACHAQDFCHHPRRNGSRGRHRAIHADRTTCRTLAGIRPLGQVRSRASTFQGPPSARLCDPAHKRRSDHRSGASGNHELASASGQLLPDPHEVP